MGGGGVFSTLPFGTIQVLAGAGANSWQEKVEKVCMQELDELSSLKAVSQVLFGLATRYVVPLREGN